MSPCPLFDDLSALVDDGLPGESELAVRRHLDACAACTRMVRSLLALKGAAGRAYQSEAPSAALRRAIAAMAHAPPHGSRRRWWWLATAAVLLAAVGAIIFGGDQFARSMSTTTLVADHVESQPDAWAFSERL